MKIHTKITDITKDDLSDLFSTAIYGSHWLYIDTPKGEEDTAINTLLFGGYAYAYDYYAEGDVYGNLPHKVTEEYVRYKFTLADVEKGIAKAIDAGGWEAECAQHLLSDPAQLDLYEAEGLMQMIIFGEVIYG